MPTNMLPGAELMKGKERLTSYIIMAYAEVLTLWSLRNIKITRRVLLHVLTCKSRSSTLLLPICTPRSGSVQIRSSLGSTVRSCVMSGTLTVFRCSLHLLFTRTFPIFLSQLLLLFLRISSPCEKSKSLIEVLVGKLRNS